MPVLAADTPHVSDTPGTYSPTSDDDNLARVAIDDLDQRIGVIHGHLNAGQCRFLELIGELDRRAPWTVRNVRLSPIRAKHGVAARPARLPRSPRSVAATGRRRDADGTRAGVS